MILVRKSNDRGHADHGWLDSRFTFSFADYYDPKHVQFRTLRVMNDDRIAGGGGFPTHPHRDMEIVTYVLEGALAHKDSMGNGSVIKPGDVQYMSAGTGVAHSDGERFGFRDGASLSDLDVPRSPGTQTGVRPEAFHGCGQARQASPGGFSGRPRWLRAVRQDNELYAALLAPGESVEHALKPNRHAYVQVAHGSVSLNGAQLEAGDGAAISAEKSLQLTGVNDAEVLLFDLA